MAELTIKVKRWLRGAIFVMACVLAPGVAAGAELVIPGSGTPEYVLRILARAFNSRQKEHRVTIPSSTGIAGGIRDVLSGKAVLGRVGRPLTDEERSKGLAFVPIGRDAVVFVAGSAVSVRAVTSAQMVDVFTGRITDWRELGGSPGPIRAVGRDPGESVCRALARCIPAFRDISYGPGVKLVLNDPREIELLDRFDTSLGFLNRSALFAARTDVVPLALDGIEPTPANVRSGRYAAVLEFGLIHKAGATPAGAARAFLDFIASPDGMRILQDHGVLPVNAGGR